MSIARAAEDMSAYEAAGMYRPITHNNFDMSKLNTALRTVPADATRKQFADMSMTFPPEILHKVFDNLSDRHSIHAVRLTCRAFRNSAWPTFARSFDNRVFHPTSCSINFLWEFVMRNDFAPYLKHLQLSTVKFTPNGPAAWKSYLESISKPCGTHMALSQSASAASQLTLRRCLQRGDRIYDPNFCHEFMIANEYERLVRREWYFADELPETLYQIFKRLGNLEKITVVDGNELSKPPMWPGVSRCAQNLMNDLIQHPGEFTYFDLHASWRSFGLIYEALRYGKRDQQNLLLPKFSTLSTCGRVDIHALPNYEYTQRLPRGSDLSLGPASLHHHFRRLRRIDISLRSIRAGSFAFKGAEKALGGFLKLMGGVQDLKIDFAHYIARCRREDAIVGNFLFEGMADLHFQQLRSIRFANLTLIDIEPFHYFLYIHRKTLEQADFTNLGFSASMWRPVMHFLADTMELDEVIWRRDLTPEDQREEESALMSVPRGIMPTLKEFRSTAKTVRLLTGSGDQAHDDTMDIDWEREEGDEPDDEA